MQIGLIDAGCAENVNIQNILQPRMKFFTFSSATQINLLHYSQVLNSHTVAIVGEYTENLEVIIPDPVVF